MGDWSSGFYIASQILTIMAFAVMGPSFFVKNRNVILFTIIGANVLFAASFCLLSAWVGAAMCLIDIGRNTAIWLVNRKRSEEDKNRILPSDWAILIFFILVAFLATLFTAEGWLTWFSFLGTVTFSFAIWQKNVLVYRFLGLITELLWLVYNVVVENLTGIIVEALFSLIILISFIMCLKEIVTEKRGAACPQS